MPTDEQVTQALHGVMAIIDRASRGIKPLDRNERRWGHYVASCEGFIAEQVNENADGYATKIPGGEVVHIAEHTLKLELEDDAAKGYLIGGTKTFHGHLNGHDWTATVMKATRVRRAVTVVLDAEGGG